ncbi:MULTISPECIES: proline racemase family protein [Halorussus]|uniref:proline racemase family protein n=1 Tax=Halorussus TaxID=1070314 RepID=UPI00209C721A|nr:proline racemase family protein [Halorussus vallis]USZ77950.1 proline racemase family protein [Halorussus vallis]USZ77984.1 proline racemase family protein [Halorussus vallis]
MNADVRIETVDTHTQGEPTRIVTDGLDRSAFAGGTVADQRDAFADSLDWVREFLMKEPRGHDDMFGAVLAEPRHEKADVGAFFMDSGGYLDMCGHGTIGLVTALVELGEVEPRSPIYLETPAGLVETHPEVEDGIVTSVALRNVESFVYDRTTVTVDGPAGPTAIPVDVVYAGNFFALVDGDELGIAVDTANTDRFVEYGLRIRERVNDELDVVDPFTGEADSVSIAEFYQSTAEADRNVVVFGEGSVDRSPCGTGTCAKMTLLHEKDRLDVGEPYLHESIIGTRFEGRLVDARDRRGTTVVTPEVSGSARIIGKHTFIKQPHDSLDGFSVSAD